MKTRLTILGIILACAAAPAQDKPKPNPAHPKVDQQKVDEAIQKGCAAIIGQGFGSFSHGKRNQPEALQSYAELVLLTLAHSGYYADGDPSIRPLTEYVIQKEIGSTYTASLGAMALQKLNAKKYQKRIAEYAQFLCDNQCQNGQWDYGEPLPIPPPEPEKPSPTPTTGAKKRDDVATGGGAPGVSGPGAGSPAPQAGDDPGGKSKAGQTTTEPRNKGGKTTSIPRIPVRKKKPGPPNGDNSNSQYAALGLRACLDADIDVDPQVLGFARKWWTGSQNSDGGWGYNDHGDKGGGENEEGVSNTSYGSMTVGAVGALCIYDYYLGMQYKQDGQVNRGIEWLAKNYDVTKNPHKKNFAYLYYLYGLERAGILYGTERFGPNEWYPDGANHLLETQLPGGTWTTGDRITGGPRDTCFAVLFLRRGTLPLRPVATGGGDPGASPLLNPGAPVANGPAGGNKDPGLVAKKTVETFAAGWRLLNNGKGPNSDKLVDVRGKVGVLTTYPPNLTTAPTFRKSVDVPGAGKPILRVVAGHHETGGWTLAIKIDGKDVDTKAVGPETSLEGWVTIDLDLSPFSGKTVMIEVSGMPGGRGVELAYWAEISVKDREP
jgi:hypothetical protein